MTTHSGHSWKGFPGCDKARIVVTRAFVEQRRLSSGWTKENAKLPSSWFQSRQHRRPEFAVRQLALVSLLVLPCLNFSTKPIGQLQIQWKANGSLGVIRGHKEQRRDAAGHCRSKHVLTCVHLHLQLRPRTHLTFLQRQ